MPRSLERKSGGVNRIPKTLEPHNRKLHTTEPPPPLSMVSFLGIPCKLKEPLCEPKSTFSPAVAPGGQTREPSVEVQERPKRKGNIGALIIRIGFWGPVHYNYKKEPTRKIV